MRLKNEHEVFSDKIYRNYYLLLQASRKIELQLYFIDQKMKSVPYLTNTDLKVQKMNLEYVLNGIDSSLDLLKEMLEAKKEKGLLTSYV